MEESTKQPLLAAAGLYGKWGRAMHGFTLVELMVTIAVLAIISTVAVPAWQGFITRQEVASTTETLTTALNYARSTAVTRGRQVSVCPLSGDGSRCEDTTAWNNGWAVVLGSPADAMSNFNSDKVEVLREHAGSASVQIASKNISFDSQGAVNSTTRLLICGHAASQAHRQLGLSIIGRLVPEAYGAGGMSCG
ncbi:MULTISPECIES: GspH/FimT family pseudopilin [unclassified Cobetia]|uniref:GspH/FimT family pseudopilin n=1 Tax=unclassified Cobetia TaxID=2609414 RepID=UPI00159CF725|nr:MULTISPECIES: GspH/FimT family pseudopilin [unclassified Cobetia]MCO7233781.1 GspH/FimT family pseudopilin [Cobetia sp. Dlab-2-AX]MCO7236972.1 GspH/FimT family pseudopilin [Cobetia sp. Dlab-2-U]